MLRRFCGVLLCGVLLVASMLGSPVAKAADTYDIVRINLSMGDITTTDIFIDGNYSIQENESVALPRQLYTVKIEGSNLALYYGSTLLYSGASLTFIQHEASEGYNNVITLNNAVHGYCSYLGDLHFTISGGYIMVVNHIYLEEYLYGVVPNEMSDSWPQEALKAQAIAARNYAARYLNSGENYDMVDTATNQTYHGYDASDNNAIAAVNATEKQVMLSEGVLFEAFYSASNGGVTEIPQHVWTYSNPLQPYQVIQIDTYDTSNPGSKEEMLIFPKAFSDTATVEYVSDTYDYIGTSVMEELAANALYYIKISCLPSVEAAGYIAGVTGDVEIVGINSITAHTHEIVKTTDKYDYTQSHGGAFDIGGNVLYDGKDYNGENKCICFEEATVDMTVRAKKYSEEAGYVKLGDVNGDEKISISDYTMIRLNILGLSTLSDQQKLAADVNGDAKISITDYTMVRLHILGLSPIEQEDPGPGSLVTEQVNVEFDIDLHELDNKEGLYTSFYSSKLSLFVVEEKDTSWNIYQRRFGHGIGMSQRGAQQMALNGKTYSEILDFYFPNTAPSTLSIEKPALSALATAPSLGTTNATVTGCEWLNIRATADTSQTAIGRVPAGTRLEITDDFYTAEWHQIKYGGGIAYVYAEYIAAD